LNKVLASRPHGSRRCQAVFSVTTTVWGWSGTLRPVHGRRFAGGISRRDPSSHTHQRVPREPRGMLRHPPALSIVVHHGHFMDTRESAYAFPGDTSEQATVNRTHDPAACLASRQDDAASSPRTPSKRTTRCSRSGCADRPVPQVPVRTHLRRPVVACADHPGIGHALRESDGPSPDWPSHPGGSPPRLSSPPAAARKLAPKSGRYLSWLSSVRNCVWVRDRRPLRTDICIAYPPFRLTSRKSSREFGCALHCTAEREWTVRTALLTLTLALPLPRLRSRRARRLREDSTSQGGMLGLSGPLREAPHARG